MNAIDTSILPENENRFTYKYMGAMEGRINWHLNDLCNFKCTYCFFPYFTKENPAVGNLSPQQISDAFDKTQRRWHIYMAGGEPMLYPDFNELVNLLKPRHPIYISTNLSNKNTKLFAESVSCQNIISINASLHIGHHTESSLAKFIDNYLLYRSKGFHVIVTYVTYPPLFAQMERDFEYLKSKGIEHLHPLTFQGTYEGKQYPAAYTREQLKLIYKYSLDKTEMLVTMDQVNFQGKKCRAGKDYFFMDINGEVFHCGTLEGKKSYGNLFQGTFVPQNEAAPCPVCRCNDSVQGITSLVDHPTIPQLDSDLEYAVKKKYRELKTLFSV